MCSSIKSSLWTGANSAGQETVMKVAIFQAEDLTYTYVVDFIVNIDSNNGEPMSFDDSTAQNTD